MPLHKSRGSRLDPTMISAPLGDFRHTMHIGRGGDAFGDTSFLSSHGPPPPSPPPPPPVRRSESGSSLSLELELDLDLDLGPSILGDVLGVMDGPGRGEQGAGGPRGPAPEAPEEEELQTGAQGLGLEGEGLGTRWEGLAPEGEEPGSRKSGESQGRGAGPCIPEEVGRPKGAGPRPKVRFSDKREEIIGPEEAGEELEPEREGLQAAEVGLGSQGGGASPGPMGREGAGATGDRHAAEKTEGEEEEEEEGETVGGIRERVPDPDRHPPPGPTHPAHRSPSPASSTSSEYEGVTPLDRRREALDQSETESEEGEGTGQGYTFEEEFDDEIGL